MHKPLSLVAPMAEFSYIDTVYSPIVAPQAHLGFLVLLGRKLLGGKHAAASL